MSSTKVHKDYNSSQLGPLPAFGQRRALTGGSGSRLGSTLDNALGSLLDGGEGSGSTRKRQSKPAVDDANFYSSLAAQDGIDDFDVSEDDSDDDMAIPEASTKQIASSVDNMNDMEASLFSSFAQNSSRAKAEAQKKKTSTARAHQLPTPDPLPSTASGSRGGGGSRGGAAEAKAVERKSSAEANPKKKPKDFDDDLLDLFSDDEDIVPKKREKPSFDLTVPKPKPGGVSSSDSKPITSESLGSTSQPAPDRTGREMERPKSRHAPKKASTTDHEGDSPAKIKHTVDVLRLTSPVRTSAPAESVPSSRSVDFGEDDDILSGLGLEDSSTSRLKSKPVAKKTDGSRLNELLGKKIPLASSDVASKPKDTEEVSTKKNDANEEDGFTFGGYQPSIAGERPQRRGTTMEGRHGPLEGSDPLSSRPTSAPAPEKKSVRFAENLEAERPSSSPAVNDNPKSSLRVNSKPQTLQKENTPTATVSKRPPLPRKSKAESVGQNAPPNKFKEEDDLSTVVPTDRQSSVATSADNSDLLPMNESTPKHRPPSRHQAGNTPTQPSTATKLFEDNGSGETAGSDGQNSSASTLQHPVFPWQRSSKPSASSEGKSVVPPASMRHSVDHMASHDQSTSQFASFQEQLLQQQSQMQEQLSNLQQTRNSTSASTHRTSQNDIQQLSSQLQTTQGKIKELESQLAKEKSGSAELQATLERVKGQLEASEESRSAVERDCKALREKCSELESGRQKQQLELTAQVDEIKIKLHRSELERSQLQQSLEAASARHSEELGALEKANQARVKSMEESFQRRETRWREEAESESARASERLQQLEREKTDAVLALRRKLDALEASKTNEIARLQDLHRTAVEDLKREHEQDRQHLQSLHGQELEAVRAAHSHSRQLSELTQRVEASAREMGQLQTRVEQAHSLGARETAQRNKTQEEHLRVLEERLVRQRAENEAERERLQSLIARLEAHVSQQGKQLEQEQWHLQQEAGRLRAQQAAFEEERAAALRRLEEERDQVQQAKEKLLLEQRQVLSQCYEERRVLANERAELTVLQKRALEREQRDSQKTLQDDAELEAGRASVREERARLAGEGAKLRQDQERLRTEQETLDAERARVETLQAQLKERSTEIEQKSQSACAMLERGQQCMLEAQALREELAGRSKDILRQAAALRGKEQRIAADQLKLAQKQRELQLHHSQTNEGTMHAHAPAYSPSEADGSSTDDLLDDGFPPRLCLSYSPQASPAHPSTGPSHPPPSVVRPSLAQVQQQRSLRQRALEIEKDYADLEEESKFLASLQNSTLYSSYH